MAKTASIRATAAAYQQVTTTESWCRLWARQNGVPFRVAISETQPNANANDFFLWDYDQRPFEIEGANLPIWVRADGPDLDIDIAAGGTDFDFVRGLYTGGRKGAFWLPSDKNGLFQNSAGTTPVAADDDPVGNMRDWSPNGLAITQSTANSRPAWKAAGYLQCDGTDDTMSVPTVGTTAFIHLHEGFGATTIFAVRRALVGTAVLWATKSTVSPRGSRITWLNTNRFSYDVGNGSTTVFSLAPTPTFAVDTWVVCCGTYISPFSRLYVNDVVTPIGSADTEQNAPANAGLPSNNAMNIMTSGANQNQLRVGPSMNIDRVLTDVERARVMRYFGRLVGLTL